MEGDCTFDLHRTLLGRLLLTRCRGKTIVIGASYAGRGCGRTVDLVSGEPFPACAACRADRRTGAVGSVQEAPRLVGRAE